MARHITTAVVVEKLAQESGHWCTACLLPSGWLIWLTMRTPFRMHMQRVTWCDECGRQDTVVLGDS